IHCCSSGAVFLWEKMMKTKIYRFDLLVAVYIFCIIVAELMGAKTVSLLSIGDFHLNGSVALLVLPLLFTINDVIIEVYGKQRARSVVFSGLMIIVMLLGVSLLAVHLPPSHRFAADEAAYDTIFGKSARMAATSLAAFALAELLDLWVFSKIREKMGDRKLWLRNNLSNFSAQLVDTVVFISLAFYAFNDSVGANIAFLVGLIVPYWLLKCFMSAIETPFVYLGVKWLKPQAAPEREYL
ncbi:MAG TPA: queuosine precursor transporter, partial [Candidatus Saccharimonadales bacterium]